MSSRDLVAVLAYLTATALLIVGAALYLPCGLTLMVASGPVFGLAVLLGLGEATTVPDDDSTVPGPSVDPLTMSRR